MPAGSCGGDAGVDSRSVDPFALVLFGGLAALVLAVWLLGRLYPGSGLEQLGMRSAREITETREALEAEDLEQMVAARNARRRGRGEPEVSALELELSVSRELAEQDRRLRQRAAEERAVASPADADGPGAEERDLEQLLELSNARRRARGLPERSRAQFEAELASRPSAPGPPSQSGAAPGQG